ncbi:MAG: hypothetical protein ACXW1Y_02275 [Acidimicrobiia bacterium]
MKHRTLTAAIAIFLVIGTASPALAAQGEVKLRTKSTATIVAGDSAWVAINWQGKGELTDFQVVAEAPSGVEVTYPENTPGFTGLMNGHVLSDKEMDFTALRLSVPYSQTKSFEIKLRVSYASDGRAVQDDFDVTIPVVTYQAKQDIALVTDSLGSIASGESAWTQVDFTGLAPMVEEFDVVVTDPAGLAVSYPSARTSTSLNFNNVLEDSETDFAAIHVDTTGVAPGTYKLGLKVSYTMGGRTKTVDGNLALTVTG